MDDIQKPQSAYEMNSESRAVELFARDPEASLAGRSLLSFETDATLDRSLAIANLAVENPARFLELVSYLPHSIQDIFFQYYLLGRTYKQIARLMGGWNGSFWEGISLGTEAICEILANGDAAIASDAYQKMLKFAANRDHPKPLTIKEPEILGSFSISITHEEFEQCFAPMTTDGPIGKGC